VIIIYFSGTIIVGFTKFIAFSTRYLYLNLQFISKQIKHIEKEKIRKCIIEKTWYHFKLIKI